jgi:hypothetical protein
VPDDRVRVLELTAKTVVVHTVTYFCVGAAAFFLLDYSALYSRPDLAGFMRQTSDPMVMAGPLFQPIRGAVFGLAIYPLRRAFFERENGWLLLWWVLVAFGIISTFGPAPGSLEGLVYTRISLFHQLVGLPEVVVQALALAFGLAYWVNHPSNRWVAWTMCAAFVVVLLLSIVGLVSTQRGA